MAVLNLLNEEVARRLSEMPDVEEAVQQLFQAAIVGSEQRFYLAILDLERVPLAQRPNLILTLPRQWPIAELSRFVTYISWLNDKPGPVTEEDALFVLRMEMLAYCQFWECSGVQRFLLQLVKIAAKQEYDSGLLSAADPPTGKIMSEIITSAKETDLQFGKVIDALYHNLLRNCFVHSDYFVSAGVISSLPDLIRKRPFFNVSFETWNELFTLTMRLFRLIVRNRKVAGDELEKNTPYTFHLPEFNGPFTVVRGEDRMWRFHRETE